MIAGVDGCRAGWIAVLDDERGGRNVEVFPTFESVLASAARLIVIDVPIGLMDGTPRVVDGVARRLLGHRACCVFSAPYRPMLEARSHAEACAMREGIDGKRCSRQAFEIFAKIREVDALMTPALQARVFEGHPEVTFAVMQGGTPMPHGKKTAAGRAARLSVLAPTFTEAQGRLGARPRGVGRDDLLDAYAMLWTAHRVASGAARRLPTEVLMRASRAARGLRAEMLA